MRREKYTRWLVDPATFMLLAEESEVPIGYAFAVGSAYACWDIGPVAELQTLSVLPERRDAGIGTHLIDAVWAELASRGATDLALTTVATNIDSTAFMSATVSGRPSSSITATGRRPPRPPASTLCLYGSST